MSYLASKNGPASERRRALVLSSLLAIGVICAFRDVLHLPYLGDDWAILHKMAFRTPQQILALTVDPSLLQIRPLQYFYTWGVLALFGTYSSAFHIPALLAHICCSLLVVWLMRLLLGSATVAWVVGVLYGIAVNIHLTPQMWMVGSSDILGPLFVFASFIALAKGRCGWSAVALLASLMFKEFALPMLGVLILYVAAHNGAKNSPLAVLRRVTSRLWLHVLVVLPFLIYKMAFLPSPLRFAEDHPYKLSLTGPHLIRNAVFYGVWFTQTVTPFLISRPRRLLHSILSGAPTDIALVVSFSALIGLAVGLAIVRSRKPEPRESSPRPPYALLLVWAAMGMAPVYFLPNHVFAYYMAYSLPAMIAVVVLLVRSAALRAGLRRSDMICLAVVGLVLQSLWSSLYVDRWFREGDYMLRGAKRVAAVHSYLMRHYPSVPKNTAFIIDGEQMLWALRNDNALQLWYRDRSIKVYDRRFVSVSNGQVRALRPPADTEFPGTPIKGDETLLGTAPVISIGVRGTAEVVREDLR